MFTEKITRREALKLTGMGVVGVAADLALPTKALSWSSVRGLNSHEAIDFFAWIALRTIHQDYFSVFPKLENINKFEGSKELWGTGNGPDCKGATRFSQHYFNPCLNNGKGEGRAPESCAKYSNKLYKNIAQNIDNEESSKAAAWAAHFLADIFVPFHVVGCPAESVFDYLENGDIVLPKLVMGDLALGKLTEPVNFDDHYTRCLKERHEDSQVDWFDPWYWDGTTDINPYINSSHVTWEGWEGLKWLAPNVTYKPSYHHLWENTLQSFDDPWVCYWSVVLRFAEKCAKETRDNLLDRLGDPMASLKLATDAVYTLWRGAISALCTDFKVVRESGKYKISPTIKNLENVTVSDVKARAFLIKDEQIDRKLEEISIGEIHSQSSLVKKDAWIIKIDDVSQGVYELKLEVIGDYGKVPDAQYKMLTKPLKSEWPKFYEGTGSFEMKMSNSKYSKSHTDDVPISFVLDEPCDGKAQGTFNLWSTFYLKEGTDDKLQLVKLNRPKMLRSLKCTHDGESVIKIDWGEDEKDIVENEYKIRLNENEMKGMQFVSFHNAEVHFSLGLKWKFTIPRVDKLKNSSHSRSISSFKSIMQAESSSRNGSFNVIDTSPPLQKGNSGGWKTVVE